MVELTYLVTIQKNANTVKEDRKNWVNYSNAQVGYSVFWFFES